MFRPNSRGFLVWVLFLASLIYVASGCSTGAGAGKGFSLAPTHQLMDTTKSIRLANAAPLAVPRELEKQPLPPYIVEPGDVLLVQPVDLDSPVRLPGDQPVLPDGTINLGRYGHLLVAGKTVLEIEGMVKGAVVAQTKDEKDTKEIGFISVRLVSRQSKVFYVLGEVNAPGSFQLNGRETVLDALMAAGGLTERASPNNIVLSRPSKPDHCRTVLPVCYDQIVQLGDSTTNYQIAPGDRIFVPGKNTLESIFGSKCDKAPCGGMHFPCNLPPYPGAAGCGPGGCAAPVPDATRIDLPPVVHPKFQPASLVKSKAK